MSRVLLILVTVDDAPRLQFGSQIRCPHCRQWQAVIKGHTEGTDYTVKMLYFVCHGGRYYAGQEGTTSRHQVTPAR